MSYTIDETCISCSACAKLCPVKAISLDEMADIYVIDPVTCIECGACGRVCPKESVIDPDGMRAKRVLRKEWMKPVISHAKCISCEACVKVCFAGALSMDQENRIKWGDAPVLSSPKLCIDCKWCEWICPTEAIQMSKAIK